MQKIIEFIDSWLAAINSILPPFSNAIPKGKKQVLAHLTLYTSELRFRIPSLARLLMLLTEALWFSRMENSGTSESEG